LSECSEEGELPRKKNCSECQGPHKAAYCPELPCDKCHEFGHVSSNCKKYETVIICSACQTRHRATECYVLPCKKCERIGHPVSLCPTKKTKSFW
jgi:hypothetical protein